MLLLSITKLILEVIYFHALLQLFTNSLSIAAQQIALNFNRLHDLFPIYSLNFISKVAKCFILFLTQRCLEL